MFFDRTMVHVRRPVTDLTTTVLIAALGRVTATKIVLCAMPPAKCSASTQDAAKSAKSPVPPALSPAHGAVPTEVVTKCPVPCLAIYFHARRDAQKFFAVATNAHRSAVNAAQTRNIVSNAPSRVSRTTW